MTDFFTNMWGGIANLPVVLGWAVIVTLVTALITAFVNVWSTRISLDMQRLENARSVSTFIADKRQNWIDDLRNDVSKYLSLSLEISEAWKQLYWKCGNEHDEHWHHDAQGVLEVCESLRINFLISNATRDSEHHQRYMRIGLRLNNEEEAHHELMNTLGVLRNNMGALAAAALNGTYSNHGLFGSIGMTLDLAAAYTKIILKEEWQRLKREVADPNRLIREILSASKPILTTKGALPRKFVNSVASPLFTETPSPPKPPV